MVQIAVALIPLFLLLGALLFGHYPGLKTIVRISERIRPRARARAASSVGHPRPPRSHAISGGRLLAFGYAQRPPPLAP